MVGKLATVCTGVDLCRSSLCDCTSLTLSLVEECDLTCKRGSEVGLRIVGLKVCWSLVSASSSNWKHTLEFDSALTRDWQIPKSGRFFGLVGVVFAFNSGENSIMSVCITAEGTPSSSVCSQVNDEGALAEGMADALEQKKLSHSSIIGVSRCLGTGMGWKGLEALWC